MNDTIALLSAGVICFLSRRVLLQCSVPELQTEHLWRSFGYWDCCFPKSVVLLGQVGSLHGLSLPAYSSMKALPSSGVTARFILDPALYRCMCPCWIMVTSSWATGHMLARGPLGKHHAVGYLEFELQISRARRGADRIMR